jgi:diguanylate cyclase (GGDEF)-like protein/PAS domain S-box-containing protein
MPTEPHALLRATLQAIRDAVVTTDASARITSWNAAASTMTGWTESQVLGRAVEEVVDLREYGTDRHCPNPAYLALQSNQAVHPPGHCLLIGQDGRRVSIHLSATPLHSPDGGLEGCLLVFNDASEALRIAERLSYLSQHDPATGLPNRILLVDRLEQATRLADRTRELVAVLFLDLDHFHQLNEAHGQAAADEFLKETAYRLTGALRETDTVCRLGGDEFVLLLPNVRSIASIEALAAKILQEVTLPTQFTGESADQTLQTTCSMGISLYPADATDGETLMQLADGAMHKAKQNGRNQYLFARPEQLSSVQPTPAAEQGHGT